MSADACPPCGTGRTWDGDWPCCDCDDDPGLTLTVRDAATYLRMSCGNVYDLISTGLLAAIRTRRPIRVRMHSVKSLLAGEHAWWRRHYRRYPSPSLRSVP